MRRILIRLSIAILAFVVGVVTHSVWSRFDSGRMLALIDRVSTPTDNVTQASIPQVQSSAFVGKDLAWLVTSEGGELWRTEDGGKHWERLSGNAVGGPFCGISFIDADHGWAGNVKGQIWQTSDGGKSWTFLSQPSGDKYDDYLNCPKQISFVDEQNGWLIGNFSIWRTVDGGKTWTVSLRTDLVENFHWQPSRISFASRNVGLMSGFGGVVHRTMDGGLTWQSQKLVPGEADATDVLLMNERLGWLTGFVSSSQAHPGTRLYRTEDSGETWHQVPIADEQTFVRSVCFLNEKLGWAVGGEFSGGRRGIVLRTDDGGETWQEIHVGEDESYFERMTFVDSQHGWLFGENNLYRTEDGGKSWTSILRVTPMRISMD